MTTCKKIKWKRKLLSCVRLFATPWTIQSMEFSRPEYWSVYLFPSSGDLLNPGIKPRSPALQVDSLPAEPQGKPKNTGVDSLSLLQWMFPTQESNLGLLHCRRILYQLSSQGDEPRVGKNTPRELERAPGIGNLVGSDSRRFRRRRMM